MCLWWSPKYTPTTVQKEFTKSLVLNPISCQEDANPHPSPVILAPSLPNALPPEIKGKFLCTSKITTLGFLDLRLRILGILNLRASLAHVCSTSLNTDEPSSTVSTFTQVRTLWCQECLDSETLISFMLRIGFWVYYTIAIRRTLRECIGIDHSSTLSWHCIDSKLKPRACFRASLPLALSATIHTTEKPNPFGRIDKEKSAA